MRDGRSLDISTGRAPDRISPVARRHAALGFRLEEGRCALLPTARSASARTARCNAIAATTSTSTGGAIMGADPATSAVNKYLQSWDVANFLVIGALTTRC